MAVRHARVGRSAVQANGEAQRGLGVESLGEKAPANPASTSPVPALARPALPLALMSQVPSG